MNIGFIGLVVEVVQVVDVVFLFVYGEFCILGYKGCFNGVDYEVVVFRMGDLEVDGFVLFVRIHLQCFIGEVFDSLCCDCGQQFQLVFERIGDEGCGVLIYDL